MSRNHRNKKNPKKKQRNVLKKKNRHPFSRGPQQAKKCLVQASSDIAPSRFVNIAYTSTASTAPDEEALPLPAALAAPWVAAFAAQLAPQNLQKALPALQAALQAALRAALPVALPVALPPGLLSPAGRSTVCEGGRSRSHNDSQVS